jgi:hypothetical protein
MSKTFGGHQTIYNGTLKREIETIRKMPGVDRVILGQSRGIRHKRPVGSISVQTNVATGIRLVGYSDRGIIEFSVITSDIATVRAQLDARYRP